MKELMVLVERAVRPVRADNRRKMRMRQELLAHLSAAHAQEQARLGDETAALAEAARRFGDPKELTRSLQASVPVWERVLFTPLCWPKGLESIQRRAPMTLAFAAMWFTWLLMAGTAFVWCLANGDPDGTRLPALEWLVVTGAIFGAFAVFALLTIRVLSGPLRPAAVLRAAVYAAIAVVAPTVAAVTYTHVRFQIPVYDAEAAVGASIAWLGLLGLALFARRQAAAKRLREEWTNLEIGD